MERNVHKIEQRIEAALRRVRGEKIEHKNGSVRDYSDAIHPENREFILRFFDVARARVNSSSRAYFYLHHPWCWAKFLREEMEDQVFTRLTKEDVDRMIGKLRSAKKSNGKPYSPCTIRDRSVALKKALQWHAGYGWDSKKYPPEVEEVKTTLDKNSHVLPEQLLTREDIEKLAGAAKNLRDRAFVHALYESGARISEFLLTRRRDVTFDDYGAIMVLPVGKTGTRKVRLVTSSTVLAQWMKGHPAEDDPDGWLWTHNNGDETKRWSYSACRMQLTRLAERADVDKPVNPHAFRHARNTELANQLTEAQQCKYSGWVIGSDMPRVYVHLSMRDVDDAILKANGIKKDGETEDVMKRCARCDAANQAVAKLCHRCMLPLDDETAQKVSERKKHAMDPDLEEALMKLLQKDGIREQLKEVMSTG